MFSVVYRISADTSHLITMHAHVLSERPHLFGFHSPIPIPLPNFFPTYFPGAVMSFCLFVHSRSEEREVCDG
jgi:hypothetical protein